MNSQEKEDAILEAICDANCRSITSISKHTGIKYIEARRIINDAELLPGLKEARNIEDYEKVAAAYREGMLYKELEEITGLNEKRTRQQLKKVKVGLTEEKRKILGIVNQIMLERLKTIRIEDQPFYYAYVHSRKSRTRTSFESAYTRAKDILEGYSATECSKRWNLKSKQAAHCFIRLIGMQEIYRQKQEERAPKRLIETFK